MTDALNGRRPSRRSTILIALVLLLLLGVSGAAYNVLAFRADARCYPHPGQLVSAAGFVSTFFVLVRVAARLFSKLGSPDSLDSWHRVQPEIARFARVCSYDRAG
jgi:hypothetical protein